MLDVDVDADVVLTVVLSNNPSALLTTNKSCGSNMILFGILLQQLPQPVQLKAIGESRVTTRREPERRRGTEPEKERGRR